MLFVQSREGLSELGLPEPSVVLGLHQIELTLDIFDISNLGGDEPIGILGHEHPAAFRLLSPQKSFQCFEFLGRYSVRSERILDIFDELLVELKVPEVSRRGLDISVAFREVTSKQQKQNVFQISTQCSFLS